MKKLLVISFLALTSSLAYAGSGCGDKCDKDKKGDKTEVTQSAFTVACDKTCDKEKDTEKTGNTATNAQFAGEGCGKKCGDKTKDDEKTGFAASDYAVA